jgi:phage shock protein PspC (stress-responsive transcriptional regulator)
MRFVKLGSGDIFREMYAVPKGIWATHEEVVAHLRQWEAYDFPLGKWLNIQETDSAVIMHWVPFSCSWWSEMTPQNFDLHMREAVKDFPDDVIVVYYENNCFGVVRRNCSSLTEVPDDTINSLVLKKDNNMAALTKDTVNGKVFGVCAGLAEWLGVDVTVVRLLTVLSFFISGSLTFWAYIIAAIVLPDKAHS